MPVLACDTLARLLDDLGLATQCINFDHILPDEEVRQLLSTDCRNSRVSQCLLHFPDLLAIQRKAGPPDSVLLVKLAGDRRLPEIRNLGTPDFPLRVAVVQTVEADGDQVEITAHWYGQKDERLRLIPFLDTALPVPIAPQLRQRAERFGYLIA